MRHVRPQASREHPLVAADRVEHPHDSGGPLVAGGPAAEQRGELRIGGAADETDRPRVGDLGQERPQREHDGGLAASRQGEHGRAVGLPAQVRLRGHPDDDVTRELGGLRDGEFGGRPDDFALALRSFLEAHLGPREPEMVELLGIDLGELLGVEAGAQIARGRGGSLGRIVPAAEGHDEHRPSQPRGHGVNGQGISRHRGFAPPRLIASLS